MPDRIAIVDVSRKWLGTKWRHQGRSQYGIDCAGLVLAVGKELGYLPHSLEVKAYPRGSCGTEFFNYFRDNLSMKPRSEVDVGDVIVFRESIFPCHCGIITNMNPLAFIHACVVEGKVLEIHMTDQWKAKWLNCFSYRD